MLLARRRAGQWEPGKAGGVPYAIVPHPQGDADDIAQTTWLRLYESIDRVREPERLAAWISTTARRDCLRALHSVAREQPTADVGRAEESRAFGGPGEDLSARGTGDDPDRRARAPDRHRQLMSVLLASPTPSYAGVADTLDLPIGSIGPTRIRALQSLRRDPQVLALAS